MPKIGKDAYPEQFDSVGARVLAAFDYDVANPLPATVLRDDAEEPFRTVLRLDDGRIVMGSECQWSKAPSGAPGPAPGPDIPVYRGHR